jgi:hypothetical protein
LSEKPAREKHQPFPITTNKFAFSAFIIIRRLIDEGEEASFSVKIFKDRFTAANLNGGCLNERQLKALSYARNLITIITLL